MIFIVASGCSYVFDFPNCELSECAALHNAHSRLGMGLALYEDSVFGFGGGLVMGLDTC